MVRSVKVNTGMIKQNTFHQSYVLLRWTIEPKQTISYSDVSPHTSSQLITAFSRINTIAVTSPDPSHHYTYFDLVLWWTLGQKRHSQLQNITHTLLGTPWSVRHHIITNRLFLFNCCGEEFSKTDELSFVVLIETCMQIRKGMWRQALVKEETCIDYLFLLVLAT